MVPEDRRHRRSGQRLALLFNIVFRVRCPTSNTHCTHAEHNTVFLLFLEVYRDGSLRVISASELVPGDLIRVSAGARIPADARLVALLSTTLRLDQAILTVG